MGLFKGASLKKILNFAEEGYTSGSEMLAISLDGIAEGRSEEEIEAEVTIAIRQYRSRVYSSVFYLANQLNKSNENMLLLLDDTYVDWDYINKYEIDGRTMAMTVSKLIYGNPHKASDIIKKSEHLDLSNMIKAFKTLIDNGVFDDYPNPVKEIASIHSYPLI